MHDSFGTSAYCASYANSECDEAIDLRYLNALQTFSLVGERALGGYNFGALKRWLVSAWQLRNLKAFEYRGWPVDYADMDDSEGEILDLNEVVGFSPRLSMLSVRLPWQIREVKGLYLLPELTTLNLSFSRGLRHLPDLWCLPKLKRLCIVGCCQLDGETSMGREVQGISAVFQWDDHFDFESGVHGHWVC